jgi:hypothetical protein
MERLADRLGDASGAKSAEDRKLSDQLSRARELKQEMADLQQQAKDLQRRLEQLGRDGQAGRTPASGTPRNGQADRQPNGQTVGGQAAGQSSQASAGGAGNAEREQLQHLQEQYAERLREAERLQQELGGLREGTGRGTTPEGQQMVTSAPGTEAFKQDFSRWEVLHKDVTLGLERIEASLSKALLDRAAKERLKAGAADRAPDEYERAVDAYFRSLAAPKQ